MNIASLCVLAYKRPQQLIDCLESLHKTLDFPAEIIVNLDGGDDSNTEYLIGALRSGSISKLILNGGNNRGVGRSFQSCLGVAEGDYIFKLDTDLTFKPNWLSKAINILNRNTDIGALGLFDYSKWDPNDSRFIRENNVIEEREDCLIVKDFVSCAWAFRSKDRNIVEPVEDDGNHSKFNKLGTKLGLIHITDNLSWGVYKSTYVSGTEEKPFKTPTYDKPLIFQSGRV